jgi:ligand-binding SRPBCC domain-containing protein
MPAAARAVYEFHKAPDALERLTPPWEKMQVVEKTGGIEDVGSRVTLLVGPFAMKWIAQHVACDPGKMFRDVMVKGPFHKWVHTHRMIEESADSSWLEDCVEYELPLGWLGSLFGGAYAKRKLERMFTWRHERTAAEVGARKAA